MYVRGSVELFRRAKFWRYDIKNKKIFIVLIVKRRSINRIYSVNIITITDKLSTVKI